MNYHYLIVGDGRVSSHIQNWFSMAGISFSLWSRHSKQSLSSAVENATHALFLIPDGVIEDFYNSNKHIFKDVRCVHFSGSLTVEGIYSCHPLMTFTSLADDEKSLKRYSLSYYNSIPFACDDSTYFKELFPMLNNPVFIVKAEDKTAYHAACSIAGNFTVLLWQKAAEMFSQIHIPFDLMKPYMEQIFHNMRDGLDDALTGPFVRNDVDTISGHRNELKNDSFKSVYESFYAYYKDISGVEDFTITGKGDAHV